MNELNQNTHELKFNLNVPKLLTPDGKSYLDFTTIVEIVGVPSTTLFRYLKQIDGVENQTYKYKNRTYYNEAFILTLFRFQIKG